MSFIPKNKYCGEVKEIWNNNFDITPKQVTLFIDWFNPLIIMNCSFQTGILKRIEAQEFWSGNNVLATGFSDNLSFSFSDWSPFLHCQQPIPIFHHPNGWKIRLSQNQVNALHHRQLQNHQWMNQFLIQLHQLFQKECRQVLIFWIASYI